MYDLFLYKINKITLSFYEISCCHFFVASAVQFPVWVQFPGACGVSLAIKRHTHNAPAFFCAGGCGCVPAAVIACTDVNLALATVSSIQKKKQNTPVSTFSHWLRVPIGSYKADLFQSCPLNRSRLNWLQYTWAECRPVSLELTNAARHLACVY